MIRNALWVGQNVFRSETDRFAKMRPAWRSGGVQWARILLLSGRTPAVCELIEGYTIRMLHGQFIALDASTICSNVSSCCRTGESTVFASRYENGDMDDQDEKVHGVLSLFQSPGCVLQASAEGQYQGWKTLFRGFVERWMAIARLVLTSRGI